MTQVKKNIYQNIIYHKGRVKKNLKAKVYQS